LIRSNLAGQFKPSPKWDIVRRRMNTDPPREPVPRPVGRGGVLFLNWRDTSNPEGGGSEVYVERVAAGLAARGHPVTLFCAAYP
jgi:hypothetical protein